MRTPDSVVVREADRWLFRLILLVSLWYTMRGHNAPGGGFIGGLIAGGAYVLRYLAGRTSMRDLCGWVRPRILIGLGMLVAVGTAIFPIFLGDALLESSIWKADLGVFGDAKVVSASIFDFGVYLIVLGVALTVLVALDATEGDPSSVEESA